jgi:hypothetical protein
MRWMTIDPGIEKTGWAAWHNYQLLEWGLITSRDITSSGWFLIAQSMAGRVANLAVKVRAVRAVSEFPQEMWGAKGRAALNSGSVKKLAAYVGMIEGRLMAMGVSVSVVEPMAWKGQVGKDITKKRVLRDYPKVGPDHESDVYDAIGIGRWKLKERRLSV